jgi:hypothetical protein
MRTSRTLAAVILFALLAGPLGASGAKVRSPGKPPQAKPGPVSLLSHAWSLALEIWQKAGCDIDPNGRCVTTPTPLNSVDAGCVDPNGRCRS